MENYRTYYKVVFYTRKYSQFIKREEYKELFMLLSGKLGYKSVGSKYNYYKITKNGCDKSYTVEEEFFEITAGRLSYRVGLRKCVIMTERF